MTRRRCVAAAVAAGACLVAAAAYGAFTSTRTNPQTLTSVPDFLPPVAARAQVVGDVPGIVYPGRQYRVYAQVADQGNPPAGVQTVKADVTSLGGSAALSLAAGSFTAGGISYNYGSSAQTAPAGVTTGPTRPYGLTMTDALSQSSTQSFTVSVQPGCVPVAIDAANGTGGRVRAVDRRDVIRYTYSAPLKSTSLSDWGLTSLVGIYLVRIDIDRRSPGAGDVITVRPLLGGTPMPLGEIDTKANYAGTIDRAFNGTIALRTGDTVVEVVVDTPIPSNAPTLPQVGLTRMTWTPVAGVFDSFGAPCATTAVTQPTAKSNF